MVAGAILAGGAASRFGGAPKGLERVGGVRIVDHLRAVIASALGADPVLIANDPAAADWQTGLRVFPDKLPGLGSLGGIHAAVRAVEGPVVCVAWDMPFVTAALVRTLAAGLAEGYDAVLPASLGRRGMEPLCAAYGPACGPAIEAALQRGDRRAIAFHDAVRVRVLALDEVARAGDPALMFFNVNTAGDLAEAESRWRALSAS